jgi:adenylate cyclase
MERRLAAILAADVAGYSRHTERNEEASTTTLRAYRAVAEQLISAHKGHIFTSAGDSVVAEFPSIVEAIRCAVEIQSEIAVRNASLPQNELMQFRIGVNLGDVISEDNNLYGTGVNVAARLEQLAQPGGICVSQTVYDQVRKIVEIPFQDIGEYRLKNIADPVRVYRILPAPLPWYQSFLSRSANHLRRAEVAALVFLLIFAVTAASSYYLRQPAILWSTLLSDSAKPAGVAVLPLANNGSPQQQFLAGALTKDIVTELSRWRDRRVLEYQGKADDVREIGRELGVRYALEGTVEASGHGNFRINEQLKDAQTGRVTPVLNKDDSLVNGDTACRIVAKIAGGYGEIEKKEADLARNKKVEELKPDELVVLARAMMQWEWTADNFATAEGLLSRAIELDPNNGPARRERAWYALMGSVFGVDQKPESQQEIAADAVGAVKLEPDDGRARMVAASVYFFAQQLKQFEEEANQAIKDAPCDPEVLAVLGALIGNTGQWQRGVELVEKANALNPDAAEGWYHSTIYLNDYMNGDYESALDMIKQSPDFPTRTAWAQKKDPVPYAIYDYAAICGQLESKKGALEKCGENGDLSAKEAWRWLSEADCGWTGGTWDSDANKCTKTDDKVTSSASAESVENWYREWNFPDEDVAKLMEGVYKSGVLDDPKAQPIAQDHQAEPAVER